MDRIEGDGVSQMAILLHKPYLVKVTTKGAGGSKIPKKTTWFMNDPLDRRVVGWSVGGSLVKDRDRYLFLSIVLAHKLPKRPL